MFLSACSGSQHAAAISVVPIKKDSLISHGVTSRLMRRCEATLSRSCSSVANLSMRGAVRWKRTPNVSPAAVPAARF